MRVESREVLDQLDRRGGKKEGEEGMPTYRLDSEGHGESLVIMHPPLLL